ncbi:extensin family protein [Sagittula sp. S175]|uniref:extensin-like domain-containing protein n=1 Tax=Sagittula sp. S175 TaxID=3415129 RepID=UPI003C7B501C
MRWLWVLAAVGVAGGVWAQGAPEVSVRPEGRPEGHPEAGAEDSGPGEQTGAGEQAGEAEQTGEAEEAVSDALAEVPGMREQLNMSRADHAACLAVLDGLGVVYSEPAPIIPEDDRDCGILRPVAVTEIAPGVEIAPPAVVRCETAEAMALWVKDFVLPAAARMEDRGALRAIRNGSGYVCRRRNNLPDGKLSEHAFGNAFDVMGFEFAEGPPIPVQPREAEGTMAEAFQDAVRASACMEFTTVLGPGSNATHEDHLHLDIIARSSGYRLCEQGPGAQE